MHMLADLVELVIGVDTHKDTHTAAVVQAVSGAVVTQVTVPATPVGYQQLLQVAARQPGQRVWAIASTGGYGAGLTRFLHAHAEQVVELDRPKRATRRHGAKSDSLDAIRAAREALGRDQLAQPRAAGQRARCRCRWPPAARRSRPPPTPNANSTRWSLLLLTPLQPAAGSHHASPGQHLREAPAQTAWDTETIATATSLRALAHRIQLLDAEVAEHTRAITVLVRAWHPELLSRCGWPDRGRHRALCLVSSGSLPDRCRLRHAGRRRPDPCLLWPTGSGAAQPVRRPSAQPGPARGRADQVAL
jgi:transposase